MRTLNWSFAVLLVAASNLHAQQGVDDLVAKYAQRVGGADSSEKGRVMWARVKGKTENALLRMPFRSVTVVRPGLIIPMHGTRSRTQWYNVFYAVLRPLVPLFRRLAPGQVTTTERLGQTMIRLANGGFDRQVLEGQRLASVQAL